MKPAALIYLLLVHISAISQSAGAQKWKTHDGINYSYVGELKDGSIEGVGLLIQEGHSPLFGYFENYFTCRQGVQISKYGAITISNFILGNTNGLTVFKGQYNDLFLVNIKDGRRDGLEKSISTDGTMAFKNYDFGKESGRQLKLAGDLSHIMTYDITWDSHWQGLKYDIKKKELISGLWNYDLTLWRKEPWIPFQSFLKSYSFQATENEKQLVISERPAADGKKIKDTCIVVDKSTGECSFGRYENSQFVSGMANFNNKVKVIGRRINKMWNGYCVMLNADHYLYAGMFVNDEMHGKGVMVSFPANDIYIGQFKNNKVEGEGVMYSQKRILIGNFVNGSLEGYGKIILEDGQMFEGFFSNGVIVKLKTATGAEIVVKPASFDEAISFLLKEWSNNFSVINANYKYNPGVKSAAWSVNATDCVYEIPVYGYARWILPNQKGKDGKTRNEFVFTVSNGTIKTKESLEVIYNDVFSKLKACELINLSPGKKLKLIPPVNGKLPGDLNFKKFESLFTVPAYPGKKADPVIRLMVENLNGEYYITVTIKSK